MWLFDRRTDLLAFGGSALLSVVIWLLLRAFGLERAELPAWGFFVFVVCVDVAHVWATAWRIYLDDEEMRRRRTLYLAGPVVTWLGGAMLYAQGAGTFWRALAYLAAFHFVRQQYGFCMWYRRKDGESDVIGRIIDGAAIYAATLGPLVYWHAHLPLPFNWFVPDDFSTGVPAWMGDAALQLEGALLVIYLAWHARRGANQPWGKHLLVGSTALCWWLSIVASGGDFAFTVVNVLPHGIPYVVLCRRYARGRSVLRPDWPAWRSMLMRAPWATYLGLLFAVAFLEEAIWDRAIWHDHAALFSPFEIVVAESVKTVLVPLLALPQAWHYVLDGFIWRGGKTNPLIAPALHAADVSART